MTKVKAKGIDGPHGPQPMGKEQDPIHMADKSFAIIVAHGAPSDPDPLDAEIKRLASMVTTLAPLWRVSGATLAMPGSLEAALAQAEPDETIWIYPFFMSRGWFVSQEMPRRIAAASTNPINTFTPFGLDPELPALCIRRAQLKAGQLNRSARDIVLVLAAHGSQKGPAAANAARSVQTAISSTSVFGDVRLGFVEETPTITEAATDLPHDLSICLPLFATTAGHVTGDIPQQLSAAGFQGVLLPPIGEDEDVPAMIATTLERRSTHG